MPGISIIIPLYNKEKTIKRCIASILQSDHDLFEIIVVDDGSSDNSLDVVNALSDDRIKLIKQYNHGPSSARNLGAANAKYMRLMFLDADDVVNASCLSTHSRNMDKFDTQLSYVSFDVVDELTGNLARTEKLTDRFSSDEDLVVSININLIKNIHSGCFCIDKRLFESIGGYRENLRFMEITEFLFRAVLSTINVCVSPHIGVIKYDDIGNSQFQREIDNWQQYFLFGCLLLASFPKASEQLRSDLSGEIVNVFHVLNKKKRRKEELQILLNAAVFKTSFRGHGIFQSILSLPKQMFPFVILLIALKNMVFKR